MNLYRKGFVHVVDDLCIKDYAEDLQYWGIDENNLDSCCQLKFQHKTDQMIDDVKKDADLSVYSDTGDFENGCCIEFRKYVWYLFEDSLTGPQKVINSLLNLCFTNLFYDFTITLTRIDDFTHCFRSLDWFPYFASYYQ